MALQIQSLRGLGHIPNGYNPTEARRLAPLVAASPGNLRLVEDFQVAAGANPDGKLGPYTVDAVRYFGGDPPPSRYPVGRTEIPPYVPPTENFTVTDGQGTRMPGAGDGSAAVYGPVDYPDSGQVVIHAEGEAPRSPQFADIGAGPAIITITSLLSLAGACFRGRNRRGRLR